MADGLQERIARHTRDFLVQARRIRIGLQLVGIAAPLVVGVSKALPSGLPSPWPAVILTLQISFLVLGALAGALVLATDRSALTVMADANEALALAEQTKADKRNLERLNRQLEDELSRGASLGLTIDSMRYAVEVALSHSPAPELKNQIGELLDLLVASRGTLFGMGDEQWNFSVYLWNGDRGELECAGCRRPARADEDAPHRSWKPGEGHVGKAFQMRRALVCADVTDLNVRGFFDAPEEKRVKAYDDATRYRSLAALPFSLPGEVPPAGVVVATSDVPGRFTPAAGGADGETVRPIRALGKTLATLLGVSNLRAK